MPAVNPETIDQAIIAQLAKVKTANGYQNDVRAIYRIDLVPDQIPETSFPAFFVLEDDEGESFDPKDEGAYYRAERRLLIGGMVNVPKTDLTLPDRVIQINSLERDARTALLEDPAFGGACKDSVLHRTRKSIDVERGFAYFGIQMHATYHFAKGSL